MHPKVRLHWYLAAHKLWRCGSPPQLYPAIQLCKSGLMQYDVKRQHCHMDRDATHCHQR